MKKSAPKFVRDGTPPAALEGACANWPLPPPPESQSP